MTGFHRSHHIFNNKSVVYVFSYLIELVILSVLQEGVDDNEREKIIQQRMTEMSAAIKRLEEVNKNLNKDNSHLVSWIEIYTKQVMTYMGHFYPHSSSIQSV